MHAAASQNSLERMPGVERARENIPVSLEAMRREYAKRGQFRVPARRH